MKQWTVLNGREIVNENGNRVAHNYYARKAGSSQKIPIEEVFENIRLMASAPTLLELVENYLDEAEERVSQVQEEIDSGLAQPEDLKVWIDKVIEIRQVIIEAKGKP